MDKLLLQVNADNVLDVHRAFQQHADELRAELLQIRSNVHIGLCGRDPISIDAAKAFNEKIGQLLDVHWQQWEELSTVATLLRETAQDYGKSEDQINASFAGTSTR